MRQSVFWDARDLSGPQTGLPLSDESLALLNRLAACLTRLAEVESRQAAPGHLRLSNGSPDNLVGMSIRSVDDKLRIMTAIDPKAEGRPIVAIKDNTDVAGLPTGHGTHPRLARMATTDAEVVSRLRRNGAAILGKTNMFEFAYGTPHPAHGDTRNPHDPSRTAGGSSGGSAAAVAAGLSDGAFGTDTGGSIRLPAAYCGVVGFKPTHGVIPLDGVLALSPTLDHGGPIATDVATAALLYGWMAEMPVDLCSPGTMDLVVLEDYLAHPFVSEEVRAAIGHAIGRLGAAGHRVRTLATGKLSNPVTVVEASLLVMAPEAALVLEPFERLAPDLLTQATRAQISEGFAIPAAWHLRALALRDRLIVEFDEALGPADALLLPTAPTVAPDRSAEVASTDDFAQMLCTVPFNMTGQPALSLPLPREGGQLPIGLQIVGRRGQDKRLLAVALAVETALADSG